MTQVAVTGSLNIPVGALVGNTRMRVMMIFDDDGGVGCTDGYAYGETEDYCVDLVDFLSSIDEVGVVSLTCYPNPANDQVTITLIAQHAGSQSIEVLDNTGRVVTTMPVVSGRATINTASMAEGLYIYQLKGNTNGTARGKFEVLH